MKFTKACLLGASRSILVMLESVAWKQRRTFKLRKFFARQHNFRYQNEFFQGCGGSLTLAKRRADNVAAPSKATSSTPSKKLSGSASVCVLPSVVDSEDMLTVFHFPSFDNRLNNLQPQITLLCASHMTAIDALPLCET